MGSRCVTIFWASCTHEPLALLTTTSERYARTLALRFGCFPTLPHNVGIRKAQRRIHGDARRWGRRSSSRFSLLTPTRVTSVFVTGRSRSGQ